MVKGLWKCSVTGNTPLDRNSEAEKAGSGNVAITQGHGQSMQLSPKHDIGPPGSLSLFRDKGRRCSITYWLLSVGPTHLSNFISGCLQPRPSGSRHPPLLSLHSGYSPSWHCPPPDTQYASCKKPPWLLSPIRMILSKLLNQELLELLSSIYSVFIFSYLYTCIFQFPDSSIITFDKRLYVFLHPPQCLTQ